MRKKTVILIVAAVVILAAVAIIFRLFFIAFSRVPTGAMANTIIPGDHIVSWRSSGKIARGRIVVFQYPDDETFYLGRVIGLPGETIGILGKVVYINKQPLAEERVLAQYPDGSPESEEPLEELSTEGKGPYRVFFLTNVSHEDRVFAKGFATSEPYPIPADHYFIMSDNRDDCVDSRLRGPVPRARIHWEPFRIYYSQRTLTGEARSERAFKKIQ